jgi:hypothetical protein
MEDIMSRNADILDILVKELGVNQNAARTRLTELEELGGEFHSICEDACNFGTSPEQDERQEYLQGMAEIAVSKIHQDLELYVNTDPRGLPFGLILPSARSNNFGGIDWRLDTDRYPERD